MLKISQMTFGLVAASCLDHFQRRVKIANWRVVRVWYCARVEHVRVDAVESAHDLYATPLVTLDAHAVVVCAPRSLLMIAAARRPIRRTHVVHVG